MPGRELEIRNGRPRGRDGSDRCAECGDPIRDEFVDDGADPNVCGECWQKENHGQLGVSDGDE